MTDLKIAAGLILLNLPVGLICSTVVVGNHPWTLAATLAAFHTVKAPVTWLLHHQPKLNVPTCVIGIGFTCGARLIMTTMGTIIPATVTFP